MKRTFLALAVAGLTAASAVPAGAQGARYNLRSMDFDIWCTEEERLPYERCEQRLPADVEKFEAYREIVERYEIPYLREQDSTLRLYSDILGGGSSDDSSGK